LAPVTAFERIHPASLPGTEMKEVHWEAAPLRTVEPLMRRKDRLPQEIPYTGERGIRLADVRDGKASMESFLAQLTEEDLCALLRGEGMNSPKVTPGTGGAFGGVTERLSSFGLPVGCCSDGPSGIRIDFG
ncbi:MAG: beta-glucosidase, partial [Lachnospiraceae bacterium]|nr:beta-glucosidase [Lachnospiraceae bacterium]